MKYEQQHKKSHGIKISTDNYLPHESEIPVKKVHCLMQSLVAAQCKGLFMCTPLTFLYKATLLRKAK